MKEKINSVEILKDFVEKYKTKKRAPLVQGSFKDSSNRQDNILYSPSLLVTQEHEPYLKSFIEILMFTMLSESGIGISACQVGVPLQVFLIGTGDHKKNERYSKLENVPYQVFINPKITKVSEQLRSFWHGCLSAKGQEMGKVASYDWLEYEAYTANLIKFSNKIDGMASIIFQHEFRHLLGQLYLDKTHIFMKGAELRKKFAKNELESCKICGSDVPHLLSDYKIGSSI